VYDILFLGLAKDCEPTVPVFLAALDTLADEGLKVFAVVGENGSADRTRELLDRAAARQRIEVVDTSPMAGEATRLRRMALGRQLLADRVASHPSRVVCVVDIDEPFLQAVPAATLRRVTNRLSDDDVFAVGATSRPAFYDLLAYEDDDTSFRGLDVEMHALQRSPWRYYRFFRDTVYPAQVRLTKSEDLYCRSSFNGLAAYRASVYERGSYRPRDDGPDVVEHIVFHASLAEATGLPHMVVDPSLVLPMPAEHGPRGAVGFWWQRVRKVLSRRLR
jgi:hypothetical protein